MTTKDSLTRVFFAIKFDRNAFSTSTSVHILNTNPNITVNHSQISTARKTLLVVILPNAKYKRDPVPYLAAESNQNQNFFPPRVPASTLQRCDKR